MLRKPLSCERVRVNWEHPLNRGLVGWWLLNENNGNYVTNICDNSRVSVDLAPNGRWTAYNCDYGINWTQATLHNGATVSIPLVSDYTMLACAVTNDLSRASMICGGTIDGYVQKFGIVSQTFWARPYFNGVSFPAACGVPQVNVVQTFGIVRHATGIADAFANGKYSASHWPGGEGNAINITKLFSSTDNQCWLAETTPGAAIFWLMIWARAFSGAELISVYNNPYGTPRNPRLIRF